MERSYLYVPGHADRVIPKAFAAGADVVILDLEDAVPLDQKEHARDNVRATLAERTAFVRINSPYTELAERDLDVVGQLCGDIKIPKVESADDVAWVASRVPGVRLRCIIETPKGVLAAQEIAASPGVVELSVGTVDLANALGNAGGWDELLFCRSFVVAAARAAGLGPPVDSAFPQLEDLDALRAEALAARRLGFFGKIAIHPRQVAIINEVFSPSAVEVAWAHRVVEAFTASGGDPVRMPDGEFVDLPVALRAQRTLELGAQDHLMSDATPHKND
jgi:citrate lyase subunit beta/citryl-CoA lyase